MDTARKTRRLCLALVYLHYIVWDNAEPEACRCRLIRDARCSEAEAADISKKFENKMMGYLARSGMLSLLQTAGIVSAHKLGRRRCAAIAYSMFGGGDILRLLAAAA